MARFKCHAVSIRNPCHRQAILSMTVSTAGPFFAPPSPPSAFVVSGHVFPSSTIFSFAFVFRHHPKNCPPSACPNRDRRHRYFTDVFSSKIVRTYYDTIHLPATIVDRQTVRFTSVGFVVTFFAELQRKYASLRFFKAVAVCSSISSP